MTKILYIASPPYSGSTLLAFLLATHPDIGTIGERGHFHRKMVARPVIGSPYCSCGKRFAECPFWQQIEAKASAQVPPAVWQQPFSTYRLFTGPRLLAKLVDRWLVAAALQGRTGRLPFFIRHRYQAMRQANASLIQAVLEVSNKSVFLDSSKSEKDALLLNDIPDTELYLIQLLRDGRAQVHSTLGHHANQTIESASRQWAGRIKAQQTLLQKANLPYLPIKYEQLCQEPQAIMDEIFNFARLAPGRGSLQFRRPDLHLMGNPMRLESNNDIKDKTQWRTNLTPAQLQIFEQIAGSTNRDLGYTDPND